MQTKSPQRRTAARRNTTKKWVFVGYPENLPRDASVFVSVLYDDGSIEHDATPFNRGMDSLALDYGKAKAERGPGVKAVLITLLDGRHASVVATIGQVPQWAKNDSIDVTERGHRG